jgi:hypothetical protein
MSFHIILSYARTQWLNIDNYQGRDPFGTYIGRDICTHNTDSINNYDPVSDVVHCCMLLLLEQYGLCLLNCVI